MLRTMQDGVYVFLQATPGLASSAWQDRRMVAFDAPIKELPLPDGKPVGFVFAANGCSPPVPRSPPRLMPAGCRSDWAPGRAGARSAVAAAARFSPSIKTAGIAEGFEAHAPNTDPVAADARS